MSEEHSAAPTNKVLAATLGAAVATILIFVFESAAGIDLPTGVEGAVVVLCTFAAGYIKSEG